MKTKSHIYMGKMVNLVRRTQCYLWRHIVDVKLNLSLTFRKEQTVENKNYKSEERIMCICIWNII